jgi:glycosyltransferase involved in cell wall biosynthesis
MSVAWPGVSYEAADEMDEQPLLSLIIPAFNEGTRLPQTLPQIIDFVGSQTYSSEVIVINNNSSDNTRQIADDFAGRYPFVRVLDERRQGKGAAVRTGMLAAHGEYLFMADADLSMPISEVNKFLPPQLENYDVAMGSREVEGAVRYDEPAYRHFMGRVFNLVVRLLAVPGFQDTQCGFKCFRRSVALDVLPFQSIDGWAFDVELLFIAQKRGYKIIEVPVAWYYRANSRISPFSDAVDMFREVLKIRLNGRRGHYDKPGLPAPGSEPG